MYLAVVVVAVVVVLSPEVVTPVERRGGIALLLLLLRQSGEVKKKSCRYGQIIAVSFSAPVVGVRRLPVDGGHLWLLVHRRRWVDFCAGEEAQAAEVPGENTKG